MRMRRTLGEASRPHALREEANGRREQDPADWLAAFRGAFGDAVNSAGINTQAIRAIGVSGQQHGLVALDAAGEHVHPAKLWCDTATHNSALVEKLGGEEGCLDKLGLVLQAGSPVIADNAMVANFCSSSGGWLPLICTMNVTSATTRVREKMPARFA